MNDIWNIILHTLDGNKLVNPKNNPSKSGKYLCTCVGFWDGKEVSRYLQLMFYDAKKECWHDCGNASGISHNILAWTDKIQVCDFNNYKCLPGGYFLENK